MAEAQMAALLLTFPLSGILLWAGLEKLRERGQFMGTLAQLGFAGRAGSLLAVVVPVAEIVTGAGLVLVPSATWPVASVAGLGVLFAAAGLLALRTGRNITCSCLGAGGSMLGRRQIGLLPAWLGVAAALYLLAPAWPASQGIQYLAAVTVGIVAVRAHALVRLASRSAGYRKAIGEAAGVRRPIVMRAEGVETG
ncbi:MauE/DoxX family redox-associated membrane protein [Nonomuraea cavernae]|uniref:MauE/DoxX family redox-associated membrane protein n=1 Tax=Nonomuraea cavernae TaxID=2045107 RepID=UPI0034117750